MKTTRTWALLATVIGAMSIAAGPAKSAEVVFTGGFNSYYGPAWNYSYPTIDVTTNFQRPNALLPLSLTPSNPLPGDPVNFFGTAGIGIGELSLTYGGLLPPASSVEFWQSFGGSKDAVNKVAFTPAAAQTYVASPLQEYLLGTFTFQNGGWFGTIPYTDANGDQQTYTYPDSSFTFSVTATIPGVSTLHTFVGTLRLHVTGPTTPNPSPADDADYFYFAERTDLGYVGAYESYNTPSGLNYGSIDLYGRIGSLIPTRFDNASGVVLASNLPAAPVPEPETYVMLLAGFGLLAALARRRKMKQ